MAAKESQCLIKQYVMKTYGGVAVQVQSFLMTDLHIEMSAQFVAVGVRRKDTNCQLDWELCWPNWMLERRNISAAAQVKP
jgi:hypothetical protein